MSEKEIQVGYVWDTLYGWHDTGTGGDMPSDPARGLQPVYRHYSSPEPKRRLNELIQVSKLSREIQHMRAIPCTREDILRVHTEGHWNRMVEQSALPKGGDCGDGASPFGHNALDIAVLSAGGAIVAVDAVLDGQVDRAYALINPPGHHACKDKGMGFCMFNNSSVAVAHALERNDVSKAAIVDWDVHHGNGTQDIWWDNSNVLTISIHQDRNYPVNSGFVDEIGSGAGIGFNINIPLPPGSGDAAYCHAITDIVVPALEDFSPDLIVISSGYDAAMMDPLGRMMVTAQGFNNLTRKMVSAAELLCDGKLVFIQEGGYCQYYVPFCGLATLEALTEKNSGFADGYSYIVEGQIRSEVNEEQKKFLTAARDAYMNSRDQRKAT